MSVTNTAELRGMLLETIEEVRRGKCDPKKAAAIGGLTGKILQSARLDLDVIKLNRLQGKAKIGEGPMLLIGQKAKAKSKRV